MDMSTIREKRSVWNTGEPNAVNVEAFHSPILDAGERYYSETIYCFSVRK